MVKQGAKVHLNTTRCDLCQKKSVLALFLCPPSDLCTLDPAVSRSNLWIWRNPSPNCRRSYCCFSSTEPWIMHEHWHIVSDFFHNWKTLKMSLSTDPANHSEKRRSAFIQPHSTSLLCHTVHKCHTPVKDLHHFPSRIMGKPVQISKCQLRINTFQLCSARAAAGGRGSLELCQAFSPHWGLIMPHTHWIHKHTTQWKHVIMQQLAIEREKINVARGQLLRCQDSMKKNKKHPLFKCLSADWGVDPEEKNNYPILLQSSHVFWWWWWVLVACHHCSTSTHACHYCHSRWWVICASLVQQASWDLFWPVS